MNLHNMKIAIKNNKVLATTVISENAFPDCEFVEVSNNLKEIIDALIKPMWNGSEVYEGATPEEIAQQTQFQIQEYKIQQYQKLLPTDWYYTRFLETGQEVPLEIKQQRQEIRDKYDTLIQEINNE